MHEGNQTTKHIKKKIIKSTWFSEKHNLKKLIIFRNGDQTPMKPLAHNQKPKNLKISMHEGNQTIQTPKKKT